MFGLIKAVSMFRNGFFILNHTDNNNYHYKNYVILFHSKNFFMINYSSSQNNSLKKILAVIIAVTAWTAIIFQAYLNTGSFGNLFSYFTILTNLLIAISISVILIFPTTSLCRYFNRASVQTGIALYIFIVALVYNTVLRGIVTLNGWNLFVDTLLHVLVPILYVVFWFFFVRKGTLQFKHPINWLIFPFAYLVYSLTRGAFYKWYPYPFLNVSELGFKKVVFNSGILLFVFLISGFALIFLDKRLKNNY